jgi:hypothetical protein
MNHFSFTSDMGFLFPQIFKGKKNEPGDVLCSFCDLPHSWKCYECQEARISLSVNEETEAPRGKIL